MPTIDAIIAAETKRFETALREAFKAGEAHAKQSILAILGSETGMARPAPSDDGANPERKRAPRGLPRAFVTRVIKDNDIYGSSLQDIAEAAVSDDERMIALSTIRGELRKGKDKGRFLEKDGLWHLGSNKIEDDQDDDFSDIV